MSETTTHVDEIFLALESVMDPEIPTLSIIDMGMITEVLETEKEITVKMIPTFTACPAIQLIKSQIRDCVSALGFHSVEVVIDDSIIWDSNRITAQGKQRLEKFGLATSIKYDGGFSFSEIENTSCPHCGSDDTTMKSLFGSTLCRSIHFCFSCKQSFERFKPL